MEEYLDLIRILANDFYELTKKFFRDSIFEFFFPRYSREKLPVSKLTETINKLKGKIEFNVEDFKIAIFTKIIEEERNYYREKLLI